MSPGIAPCGGRAPGRVSGQGQALAGVLILAINLFEGNARFARLGNADCLVRTMSNAVVVVDGSGRLSSPVMSTWSRWRAGVAGLFPAAEPVRTARVWVTCWYVVAFAAAAGYLLLIPAGRSRLDHVWAEDGSRFLFDAYTLPWASALVTPYGGYLHSVPRLASELVSQLPLSWAAAGLAISAAVLRAGLALLVFAASGGFLRSLPVRLALAALVVLAPVGNVEALNNLANFHWFALYGAFWMLLWRPASRWASGLAAVVVFVATTTSPLVLLLAPLALARFALPGWRQRMITLGFCLGAAVQSVAVLLATRVPYSSVPVDLKGAALTGLMRVPLVAFTSSEDTALIYRAFNYWPAVVALVAVLCLAGLVLRWGGAPRRALVVAAVGYSALFISLALMQNWQPVLYMNRSGVVDAQRYSVAPCLFLLTAVAVGLDRVPRAGWRRLGMLAARAVVAAVLLTGIVRQLPMSAGHLSGVPWDQTASTADRDCAQGKPAALIRQEPAGWDFELPCDRLG
jgi:hypothetical protein